MSTMIFEENSENISSIQNIQRKTLDKSIVKDNGGKKSVRKALSSLSTSQINIRSNHKPVTQSASSKVFGENLEIIQEKKTQKKLNSGVTSHQKEEFISSFNSSKMCDDPVDEVVRLSKDFKHKVVPFYDFDDMNATNIPSFDFIWDDERNQDAIDDIFLTVERFHALDIPSEQSCSNL